MKVLAYLMLSVALALPKNKALSNNANIVFEEGFKPPEEEIIRNSLHHTKLPQTVKELHNCLLALNYGDDRQEQQNFRGLEPIKLDNYILVIPSELIFLHLHLKEITASGFSNFIIYKSQLDSNNLTFNIDIEFPYLHILCGEYELLGYIYSFIPLYGKGRAEFHVNGFRIRVKLILEPSGDGKTVLIKEVEHMTYIVPHMKSNLNGVLGGGDVDAVVNALIDEVILRYINRFHGAIANLVSPSAVVAGNTLLHHLYNYINSLQNN